MKKQERLRRIIQLVVIAFFIVMAVSGGTQLFLSPQRVAGWIKDRMPDYDHLDIEFSKAQISFSGSLFPLFGIKAKGVLIRYHGCSSSLQLNAPYVLIPFSMTDAIQKKIRLGFLKLGDVDLQVLEKENVCIDQEAPVYADNSTAKVTEALENKSYEKLFESLHRPFRGVKGLKVQTVNVYKPEFQLLKNPSAELKAAKLAYNKLKSQDNESPERTQAKELLSKIKEMKTAEVQRLRVAYNKVNDAILLSGGIKVQLPGFDSFRKLPIYWMVLEFNKEKGLKLNAQARYNEGRFYLDSKYQKDLEALKVHWKANDFPLSFVMRTLDKRQNFSQLNTNLIWLNGEGFLGFSYEQKKANIDILANSLRLRGDMVDASAQDVALKVYPNLAVQKLFEWRLEKLDLEQMSEFLEHKGLKGVLRRAGHLRGSGIVNAFDDVVFEGSVEGLEFFFSSSGQKAFQKVQKAELNLEYLKDRLKVDIDRIVFGEGEVEGQTSFEIKQNAHGDYQWSFASAGQSLRFNDQIYSLFKLKPFSFDKYSILVQGQKKTAHRIAVTAAVDHCETEWGAFENLGLQISLPQAQQLDVILRSKNFVLDSKHLKTSGLIPASLNNVNLKMSMDLNSDLGDFEFVANDKQSLIKMMAKDVDYNKKAFDGVLIKSGTTYGIHGNLKQGYQLKIEE